jgi:hypothetical protein
MKRAEVPGSVEASTAGLQDRAWREGFDVSIVAIEGRLGPRLDRQLDLASHMHGRPKRNAENRCKATRADLAISGGDEINRLKPDVNRQVALVERCLVPNGEKTPAAIAFPSTYAGCISMKLAKAATFTTMRADRPVLPRNTLCKSIRRALIMKTGQYCHIQ